MKPNAKELSSFSPKNGKTGRREPRQADLKHYVHLNHPDQNKTTGRNPPPLTNPPSSFRCFPPPPKFGGGFSRVTAAKRKHGGDPPPYPTAENAQKPPLSRGPPSRRDAAFKGRAPPKSAPLPQPLAAPRRSLPPSSRPHPRSDPPRPLPPAPLGPATAPPAPPLPPLSLPPAAHPTPHPI